LDVSQHLEQHAFSWRDVNADATDILADGKKAKKHAPPVHSYRPKCGKVLVKLATTAVDVTRANGGDVSAPELLDERDRLLGGLQSTGIVPEKELKFWVGTWNLGKTAPPGDLEGWIPELDSYDVVAIGLQESEYSLSRDPAGRRVFGSAEGGLCNLFSKHCGRKFRRICAVSLREIRLFVFCKAELLPFVSDIATTTKATGIGNVIGNKGAASCYLNIYHTRIGFLSAHLAAHQDRLRQRNDDYHNIMLHADGDSGANPAELLHKCDTVFFFGDLNYRLAYGTQGDKRSPSTEQFTAMVKHVKEARYDYLAGFDQLKACIRKKESFTGFEEGDIKFPPTFKVYPGIQLQYKPQRSPAYCDRILWHARKKSTVSLLSYEAGLAILSSDHKPVSATFNVKVQSLTQPDAKEGDNAFLTVAKDSLNFVPVTATGQNQLLEDADVSVSGDVVFFNAVELRMPGLARPLLLPYPYTKQVLAKLNVSNVLRLNQSSITARVFKNKQCLGTAVVALDMSAEQLLEVTQADSSSVIFDVPFEAPVMQESFCVGDLFGVFKIIFKHYEPIGHPSKTTTA
jgi:endonuclease/exonuclease/phosphatase family metal-dependent hydrolase